MASELIKKLAIWSGCGVAVAGGAVGAYLLLTEENKVENMLEYVPANSDFVISFDTQQVITSSGSSIDDGKIVQSASLEKINDAIQNYWEDYMGARLNEEELKLFQKWQDFGSEGIIGYEGAVMVMNFPKGDDKLPELYCMASINDESKFIESIEDLTGADLTFEEIEGYQTAVYEIDSYEYDYETNEYTEVKKPAYSILLNDGIAWLVSMKDGEDAVEYINSQIEEANEESIIDIAWKNDLLAGKHSMAMLIDTKPIWDLIQEEEQEIASIELGDIMMNKDYTDSYFQLWCDVIDQEATITAGMVTREGKELQIPFIGNPTINSEFTKYLSKDDMVAISLAIPKGLDYKQIAQHYFDLAGKSLPYNFDEQLAQIKPYLDKIEGATVSIAGGLKNIPLSESELQKPSNYDFVAVASLQPGVAQEALDYATTFAQNMGAEISRTNNGIMFQYRGVIDTDYDYDYYSGEYRTIETYDQFELYLSVVGNDLVFANRPIAPQNDGSFNASLFNGKVATAILEIPKGHALYKKISEVLPISINPPFGLRSQISINPTNISWTTSITGNNGLLLDEIFKYVASFL